MRQQSEGRILWLVAVPGQKRGQALGWKEACVGAAGLAEGGGGLSKPRLLTSCLSMGWETLGSVQTSPGCFPHSVEALLPQLLVRPEMVPALQGKGAAAPRFQA